MLIGYKEWSLVCEALGAGAQTILLRKGGIAEGKEGFAFKHPHFYLFPTMFHQQGDNVLWKARQEPVRTESGAWLIRYSADVIISGVLTDWEKVEALRPFHVWKESVVSERFAYETNNQIHVALVRVKKLINTLVLEETPALRGCRSWVECPMSPKPGAEAIPVLTDAAFAGIENTIRPILSPMV